MFSAVLPARIKAFLLHLAASLLVALLALCLVFGVWYPSPLDSALAVQQVFVMLVAIDVILGPSLTLLVYKVGKKSLRMDLAVIVLVQLLALSYGLWVVAQARPAWLVFNADRFDLVQAVDIDLRTDEPVATEYRQPAWSGPVWVGAVAPVDIEKRNAITFEAALGGSDIAQRPNLYVPLATLSESIDKKIQDLSTLEHFNDRNAVRDALAAWPQARGWLPLMARAQPMVVLMGPEPAQVLAVVALKPWE